MGVGRVVHEAAAVTHAHPLNLCPTVENRPRYETLRCTVGYAIDPYANGGRRWTWSHQWTDRRAGLEGGSCIHCGKTLKEVRVRINPKTGEPVRRRASSLARAIAMTPADVPPVVFVGGVR